MSLFRLMVFSGVLLFALVSARPAAADEHTVFDLVANRAHAHLLRGGGVAVDAGAFSFPRYVQGDIRGERWRLSMEEAGVRFAVARTRQSWLFVPLNAEQASRVDTVRLRVRPARGGQPLSIKLNDKTLSTQPLESDWQTVTFTIPPGTAREGENRLDLDFGTVGRVMGQSAAGALAWVTVEDALSAGQTAPDLDLGAAGEGARVAPGTGMAWYHFVPEGSNLRLLLRAAAAPCSVVVTVEGPTERVERNVSVTTATGEARIPLAPLAGDVARLTLRAGAACGDVLLVEGGLVLASPAPRYVRTGPPPKRVVLYIIDTLRADRLSAWNPESRVRTPVMDRLGREGAVFLQAYSQGNESYVSHAAIFTGQYPRRNRVNQPDRKLTPEHLLISEAMQAQRFRTAGFTSNGYIDVRNGYLQGWHTYVNTLVQKRPYLAPGLIRQTTAWMGKQGEDARYFLYVGPVDPHVTYRANEGIIELYDPDPYHGPYRRYISGVELGQIKGRERAARVSARDRFRIEALYDNEVDFSDRWLGNFIQFLEDRGELDETMIIVTSDHGEEFWEHGDVGHGHSVYEEMVHVPLIIRYPGLIPAGTRVKEGVDTIDIFPTIVDAVGAPRPDTLQGESLIPLAHGMKRGYPRASMTTRHGFFYGVRADRYKMISWRRGLRRLYDLATDPTEQKDVLETNHIAARWMADVTGLIVAYEERWDKETWGSPTNLTGQTP